MTVDLIGSLLMLGLIVVTVFSVSVVVGALIAGYWSFPATLRGVSDE